MGCRGRVSIMATGEAKDDICSHRISLNHFPAGVNQCLWYQEEFGLAGITPMHIPTGRTRLTKNSAYVEALLFVRRQNYKVLLATSLKTHQGTYLIWSRGGDVSKNIKSIWVIEVGSQSWLLVKPRMTFAPTESRSITFPQDSRLFDENPVPCNLLLIVKDIPVDVGLAMNSRKLSLLVAIPAEYPLRMLSSVWLWSSLSDGRNP
ncbi:hypothetical protein F2Q70_00026351 [Brassica cretica]|uniref:Uncharacterized protein n=1 Tax=Brassica cretica TaxID=69181 RepID=A0A8S9L6C3_BRACR|nr:hypothetical protein F2Q70_00026351 [Brassica cretica]